LGCSVGIPEAASRSQGERWLAGAGAGGSVGAFLSATPVGSAGFSGTHNILIVVAWVISVAWMVWLAVVAWRMQDSEAHRLPG
jgi:hypothetical protein